MKRYPNPIVPQRADPWVLKHSDGFYYMTASVPEYDRIELRRARTIQGLGKGAEIKVVWRKYESGPMSWHVWAPEIHCIDGAWYIYFAAGEKDAIWKIRPWALSNASADPFAGEFIERGRVMTDFESFSLDATTFEHRGKRYFVWAQKDLPGEKYSDLYIAQMHDPLTLKLPATRISRPELPWECVGFLVNEGPAALKRNGKIFISFSASATDENYCMGLLYADEDADLLNAASWKKRPTPVFQTSETNGQFGPGHNSFTTDEHGQDVLIYHARPYKGTNPNPLQDPNRHMRAQSFTWDQNGFPVFGEPVAD